MIIKFSWYSSQMTVDAERLILDMPIANYRKWVKLFARHGKREDCKALLQLLEEQIQGNKQAIKDETDEEELPHLRRMLKRRVSMFNQLKELW